MRALLLCLPLLLCGCHDGNHVIDPCFVDADDDKGCGNDKPSGSLDCDERPPCNLDEVIGGDG